MIRSLAVLAVIVACAPVPVETRAPAGEAPRQTATAVKQPVERSPLDDLKLLKPWQKIEEAWKAAPVWLVTQHRESGSCEVQEDGGMVMYALDRLIIGEVLRGEVAAPEVTVIGEKLRGPRYPRAFAEGRHYLVFIKPGERGRELLAQTQGTGLLKDRMGPDEVIAVVDLDASEMEVAAEAVVASREGELDGFKFDAELWRGLREAPRLAAGQLGQLVGFLQAKVLQGRAPLAEVRAWLGPPDRQTLFAGGNRSDLYVLTRETISGRKGSELGVAMILEYNDSLQLYSARLRYTDMRRRSGSEPRKITDDELKRRKLPVMNFLWAVQ